MRSRSLAFRRTLERLHQRLATGTIAMARGAAQAAAESGDNAKAKRYFARLVELAGKGDPRLEIDNAKAFLAKN